METATQALHRLTAVDRWDEAQESEPPVDDVRVVRGFTPMDPDRLPWFWKRYAEPLPVVDLPRDLSRTSAGTIDVLSGAAQVAPETLTLASLGRMLFLAAGVTRTMQRPTGTWPFRAAGSAGGRFPLELYVAVPVGRGLPPGVHWYEPQQHALVTVGPPPRGEAVTAVVTGVPWRTGWKYRERGYRHVHWDAGTMLAQLLVAAASGGVDARLHTRFPDAAVAALVGADGVHEWPVALVALGAGAPVTQGVAPAATGAVDADPVEFPLVTAARRAGDLDELGPAWPLPEPVDVPRPGGDPVDDVILRRGSQRRMDPAGDIPADVLQTAMRAAMRGIDVRHWVAVHRVRDTSPGLYAWPRLDAPVRAGDLREEMYHACMDQGLGRDAAFVAVAAADLAGVDDHGYRDVQLAAGLVEGRLHLAAYGLGASASGMTFVDGLIPSLLGEDRLSGLLFTCVGTPEYASRAGGAPGAPTPVRLVTPRY